jgi:hypothetical protein
MFYKNSLFCLLSSLCLLAACSPTAQVNEGLVDAPQELVANEIYSLTAEATGLRLQGEGQQQALNGGLEVQQVVASQAVGQQWLVKSLTGTASQLLNVQSGQCLDVQDGAKLAGTKLVLSPCSKSLSQSWQLQRLAPGVYTLLNTASGLLADGSHLRQNFGADLIVWPANNGTNQRWDFRRVAAEAGPSAAKKVPDGPMAPAAIGAVAPAATAPAAGTAAAPAPAAPLSVKVGTPRAGQAVAMRRPGVYDYAPAVMMDETSGTYRMWWCGGSKTQGGDHILYAEAQSLDGPWHARGDATPNSFNDVFQPTYSLADWDGQDVCDPSVVRVDGTYYMYYGGLPIVGSPQPMATAIGLATSGDGLSWTRAKPTPIVTAARDINSVPNTYGAGQPSVISVDGQFLLAYTDTTGVGAKPQSGAGIFLLRSPDPTFAAGVQELQATGFAPSAASNHTAYPLLQAFSIDWSYSDVLQRYVLVNETAGGGAVTLFTKDFKPTQEVQTIIPYTWGDGPGIATNGNRHLPSGNACGVVPVDVMRGMPDGTTMAGPNGWDLGHAGVDLQSNVACTP